MNYWWSQVTQPSSLGLLVLVSVSLSDHVWGWNSKSTGSGVFILGVSELGGVSGVSISSGLGSDSHNSCMNGAWNTVLRFDVDFGKMEGTLLFGSVSGVILDIFSGRFINQLFHLESLDSLILSDSSAAVHADNDLCSTLVLFTSSVISSLLWHIIK